MFNEKTEVAAKQCIMKKSAGQNNAFGFLFVDEKMDFMKIFNDFTQLYATRQIKNFPKFVLLTKNVVKYGKMLEEYNIVLLSIPLAQNAIVEVLSL